jgi:hypothetical protein
LLLPQCGHSDGVSMTTPTKPEVNSTPGRRWVGQKKKSPAGESGALGQSRIAIKKMGGEVVG